MADRRMTMLAAGILASVASAFAQEPARTPAHSTGNLGLSVVLSRFQTENFGVSTGRGVGGWIDVGGGQWTTNFDASIVRRKWVFGVSALRRIEMAGRPETIHFLFGAGIVSRSVANDMTGAVAGGIGMDIPARRFVTRIQYRLYCAGADGPFISQFRAGVGLTY